MGIPERGSRLPAPRGGETGPGPRLWSRPGHSLLRGRLPGTSISGCWTCPRPTGCLKSRTSDRSAHSSREPRCNRILGSQSSRRMMAGPALCSLAPPWSAVSCIRGPCCSAVSATHRSPDCVEGDARRGIRARHGGDATPRLEPPDAPAGLADDSNHLRVAATEAILLHTPTLYCCTCRPPKGYRQGRRPRRRVVHRRDPRQEERTQNEPRVRNAERCRSAVRGSRPGCRRCSPSVLSVPQLASRESPAKLS